MPNTLRSKVIRLAYTVPALRAHLLPVLTMPAVYGPPDSFGNTPSGPWMPRVVVTADRPEWHQPAEDARHAALKALPPCRCLGPTASIQDNGRGPILDVSSGHPLPSDHLDMMSRAVSELGWREWARTDRGIAFKPTSVNLG
jgi:hypothetical protein